MDSERTVSTLERDYIAEDEVPADTASQVVDESTISASVLTVLDRLAEARQALPAAVPELSEVCRDYGRSLAQVRDALRCYQEEAGRLQGNLLALAESVRQGTRHRHPNSLSEPRPQISNYAASQHLLDTEQVTETCDGGQYNAVFRMREAVKVRARLVSDADDLHAQWIRIHSAVARSSGHDLPEPVTSRPLPPKEVLALQLLANGYSPAQIAEIAGATVTTVEQWLRDATVALDAVGALEAAGQAIWEGLIL